MDTLCERNSYFCRTARSSKQEGNRKIQIQLKRKFLELYSIYIFKIGIVRIPNLLKEKNYYLFKQDINIENYIPKLNKKTPFNIAKIQA